MNMISTLTNRGKVRWMIYTGKMNAALFLVFLTRLIAVIEHPRPYVRTKAYFGPCRRRRGQEEYRGPERRAMADATAVE